MGTPEFIAGWPLGLGNEVAGGAGGRRSLVGLSPFPVGSVLTLNSVRVEFNCWTHG